MDHLQVFGSAGLAGQRRRPYKTLKIDELGEVQMQIAVGVCSLKQGRTARKFVAAKLFILMAALLLCIRPHTRRSQPDHRHRAGSVRRSDPRGAGHPYQRSHA